MPLSAEDWVAIQELYARSAWTFDTGDAAGFVDTFTADGTLDMAQKHAGQAAITAFMADVLAKDPWLPYAQHLVTGLQVTGDGSRATARAYVTRTHRLPGANRGNCMVVWAGYSTDALSKTAAGWRFSARTLRAWEGEVVAPIVRARTA